jgi:hypothetical protein
MIVSKDYDPIEGGIRPFAIWQERLGIGPKRQNKIWDLTVMSSDQDGFAMSFHCCNCLTMPNRLYRGACSKGVFA